MTGAAPAAPFAPVTANPEFATARLTALAQVAAGLAPALSDLLTVIRGQAGVLLDRAEPEPATLAPLNKIYSAAEKAATLLRQLQIFSGLQPAHAEPIALNPLIEETSVVLVRLLGDGIAVQLQLAPGLPPILADRGMLEQLLLILALNAGDAMPAGGTLLIRTETVERANDAGNEIPAGRPGKFAVLHVEDTGRGIAPDVLPRLFEPFFTTKPAGRSLGLGLATALGIVRQHHGEITVNSSVGGGTRFRVVLPLAAPDAMAAVTSAPATDRGRGGETILLVEDDAGVREFTAMVLQEHGYRVLQAGTGEDALEAWQWHGPRVRLLLTDMVLEGGLTGLELASKLRAENPGLKVICTTGYQREALKNFPPVPGGYHYLQKPCRFQTLVADVRTLLDGKQP